jgi:hypothetical protein
MTAGVYQLLHGSACKKLQILFMNSTEGCRCEDIEEYR